MTPAPPLPPIDPPRRSAWPLRLAIATPLLVLVGGGAFALAEPKPSEQLPRPSRMTTDQESVTLTPDAPQWRYVELAVAKSGPPLTPVPAPGRVDIDERRTASVSSPLAGQIDQVKVRVGDRVKEGTPLVAIRSGALADLQHDIEAARAAVETRTALVNRLTRLLKLQAASERDLLAAEAELRESQLQLRAAEARRKSLRINAEGDTLFWITAPRSGTVVELNAVANQQVGPDRDAPLLRLSDLSEVIVLADVQERDASELRSGMAANIRTTALADAELAGRIEHVSEVVDPQRRTVAVRVRVANPELALRPNAFVEVIPQPGQDERVVRVPRQAVVTGDSNRPVMFVAADEGRLRRVPVQTGRERDGEVEIRNGLQPGARFVSRGALLLLNQIELNEP